MAVTIVFHTNVMNGNAGALNDKDLSVILNDRLHWEVRGPVSCHIGITW